MRIPRRPAWPVVFLFAACALRAESPVEALSREMARWERVQTPPSDDARNAFERAFADITGHWVERWPHEELAWRQRLRALEYAAANPPEAERALAGAERALGGRPGLRFPEDTRFLMARAAVRHGVRTEDVQAWLSVAVALVQAELPQGDQPIVQAYRRERLLETQWRASLVRATLAYRQQDRMALRGELAALGAASVVPVHDPADRIACAEKARRRAALLLWHARFARLGGDRDRASDLYERALAARPTTPRAGEPPENAELIQEAADYAGLEPGPRTPIPPADEAGPHWLPSAHRLPDLALDGRPVIVVIWESEDARQARALERLEKRPEARVDSLVGVAMDWIERVNPLYAAPQLWIADSGGTVRLVGRFQPGGDGWEDAVIGAALRLAGR